MKSVTYQRLSVGVVMMVSLAATVVMVLLVYRDQDRMQSHAASPGIRSQRAPVVGKGEPLLRALPQFSLTDMNGRDFGSEELVGKVWIVDFIFTRCTQICPIMTSRMAQVQQALQKHPRYDDVRLVSISVDGEHDTPAVLKDFAAIYEADTTSWVFLTGTEQEVWPLVIDGFGLALDYDADNKEMPISHSGRFVLVDRQRRIYNYYDSADDAEIEALLVDVDRALEQ